MTHRAPADNTRKHARAAAFAALFAAQAAVITMSPILARAASDLHVSTAVAGQLRTIAGIAAGIASIVLAAAAGSVGLRRQLLAASLLVGIGSAGSAAAPGFALLALAQVPVGIGVAGLTTAGILAAAEWSPAERRTQAVSWALIGQPAAWILGMPLIGFVGGHSWRYGWLALPLLASIACGLLVARMPAAPPAARRHAVAVTVVLHDRSVALWLLSELFANAAWAGTLVYAGALFVDSDGTSTRETGLLLASAAGAYVVGNVACRPLAKRDARRVLVLLATLIAVGDFAFIGTHGGTTVRAALFAATAFVVGGRTLVASAFAVAMPPDRRAPATSLRAATMQFGYFLGAGSGGAALAAGGYRALAAAMAALFLAAAAVLACGGRLPALYRRVWREATGARSTARPPTSKEHAMNPQLHFMAMTVGTRFFDTPERAMRRAVRRNHELELRAQREARRRERLRRACRHIAEWSHRRRRRSEDETIVLRRAGDADLPAIRHLATLTGSPVPAGPILLAEENGEIVAAHVLRSGAVLANGARGSMRLAALLDLRAQQLQGA